MRILVVPAVALALLSGCSKPAAETPAEKVEAAAEEAAEEVEEAGEELAVPADFEEEAAEEIDGDNYVEELDGIEAELNE